MDITGRYIERKLLIKISSYKDLILLDNETY